MDLQEHAIAVCPVPSFPLLALVAIACVLVFGIAWPLWFLALSGGAAGAGAIGDGTGGAVQTRRQRSRMPGLGRRGAHETPSPWASRAERASAFWDTYDIEPQHRVVNQAALYRLEHELLWDRPPGFAWWGHGKECEICAPRVSTPALPAVRTRVLDDRDRKNRAARRTGARKQPQQ